MKCHRWICFNSFLYKLLIIKGKALISRRFNMSTFLFKLSITFLLTCPLGQMKCPPCSRLIVTTNPLMPHLPAKPQPLSEEIIKKEKKFIKEFWYNKKENDGKHYNAGFFHNSFFRLNMQKFDCLCEEVKSLVKVWWKPPTFPNRQTLWWASA